MNEKQIKISHRLKRRLTTLRSIIDLCFADEADSSTPALQIADLLKDGEGILSELLKEWRKLKPEDIPILDKKTLKDLPPTE